MKRPEITYDMLAEIDPERPALSRHAIDKVQVQIKYEGYISKQLAQIQRFKRLEEQKLDPDLDYLSMEGIRIEARQKLHDHRPVSIGQASRISGVSPADINVLLVYLEKKRRSLREEA
jgi:tRNA uridine 5-carboxymethylaminomethyl modification enzyme